ncbi:MULTISPECIES: hypothetical protein [unclassified Providencia]|uniref:hypothetical protein n=1 Tax=unclassified Providencia TaxID=2633465 RepID=UPI002348FD81|nr:MULTISPECIES: hypothetical protein [unclassified Providencia]
MRSSRSLPLFGLCWNPGRFWPGFSVGVLLPLAWPPAAPVGAGEGLGGAICPVPFLWCPSSFAPVMYRTT